MSVIEHVGLVYQRARDRAYAELYLRIQVDAGFVSVAEAARLREGRGVAQQMSLF